MSGPNTILVVDDDSEFQELVNYHLRLAGFEVLQAMDGPEGLNLARNKKPEVILLDTTMPGMNGLKVLAELKNETKTKNIPVIMLTGRTLVGEIEQAFDVGADDYITKPVELKKLGQIIKFKLQKLSQ